MIRKILMVSLFVGFVGCSGDDTTTQEAVTTDDQNQQTASNDNNGSATSDDTGMHNTQGTTHDNMGKQSGKGGQQYVVATQKLNVRQGPGKSFKVIRTLKEGEAVAKVGQKGHWIQISSSPEEFVSSKYLRPAQ